MAMAIVAMAIVAIPVAPPLDSCPHAGNFRVLPRNGRL